MKNRALNRFIGVMDDRDEYQIQEIYKELAFSGMLLWYLTMGLMGISLLIDTIYNQLSFATPALLVINMVYAFMIMSRLHKKQLDQTDCASLEEYTAKKKQLKKSSIFMGIQWGVCMFIAMQYILPYLSTGEIDVSWINVLIWAIGGATFGIAMYAITKPKLKKHF